MQHVILGYNFSKAFHIDTTWNRNDQRCLTKNGKIIAATVSNKAITTSVQCTESITGLLYLNALMKCKVSKALKSKHFEKACVFEPSYRQKSDYSECYTYEGYIVMDTEVVNSGIFHIAMTDGSSRHIRINCDQIIGMLKLCDEDKYVTNIELLLFTRPPKKPETKID